MESNLGEGWTTSSQIKYIKTTRGRETCTREVNGLFLEKSNQPLPAILSQFRKEDVWIYGLCWHVSQRYKKIYSATFKNSVYVYIFFVGNG